MKLRLLLYSFVAVVLTTFSAWSLGTGGEISGGTGGCGSCEDEITVLLRDQPAMFQARAPRLYETLLAETEMKLAVLEASAQKACEMIDCMEIDPMIVTKLVILARENKRQCEQNSLANRSYYLNLFTALLAICALVISFLGYRNTTKKSDPLQNTTNSIPK